MIKEHPQISHVEEAVNVKWCVSKVLLYILTVNKTYYVLVRKRNASSIAPLLHGVSSDATNLNFGLSLHLHQYFVCELRRLGRRCDTYQHAQM